MTRIPVETHEVGTMAEEAAAVDATSLLIDEEQSGEEGGRGPGSLRDRFFRPETMVSFVIAIALMIFFVRRLDINMGEVWQNARHANPWLFLLGFVSWYSAFGLRAYRWKHMLERVNVDREHGYKVPNLAGFVEIFLLAWFANCIVPAKLGDAYRSYLLKRESGASFSTTLGTILAERLTDLTVLFVTMSAVGVLVFHGQIPAQAERTFLLGLGLLVLALVGLAVMWWSRHTLQRRLPARVQDQYGRLHDAVFACLRRPGMFLAISVGIWIAEGLRLFFVARSVDAEVSFSTALFVALMASLLTTLPLTPAGLGVVESAIVAVLVSVMDMNRDLAASIAVLDRVIGYWMVIAIGLILYARRARRAMV